MPSKIKVTIRDGILESVEGIPERQVVEIVDEDTGCINEEPLLVRHWYPDGTSKRIYAGELPEGRR